jgi:branched-chain amino acid aminotransferase
MIVSWNGSLVKAGEILLPVSDAVFLRGEGVFETVRAEVGRPCLWEKHYARLVGSACRMGWIAPDRGLLKSQIIELLEAKQLGCARVRITLGKECLITAEALPEAKEFVSAVSIDCPVNERSPLAGVKCTSYAENMILLRESGADEAIRPNTVGELCEGCISNVFFVKEGEIFTPAPETGCLPGVMRSEVIRVASVMEGRWPTEILQKADEIWLSNSLRRLRFVNCLDGRDLGRESSLFLDVRQRLKHS